MAKPKILKRLIKQLEDKGMSENRAVPIAVATLQRAGDLKKGTMNATSKGISRGNMTPAERAKNRASKNSGHKISEFKYNSKTNRATLK